MANCRSCGAEVVWAVTESGKRMPLSQKTEEMRCMQTGQTEDQTPVVIVRRSWLSHFADCPNAAQHRTPK